MFLKTDFKLYYIIWFQIPRYYWIIDKDGLAFIHLITSRPKADEVLENPSDHLSKKAREKIISDGIILDEEGIIAGIIHIHDFDLSKRTSYERNYCTALFREYKSYLFRLNKRDNRRKSDSISYLGFSELDEMYYNRPGFTAHIKGFASLYDMKASIDFDRKYGDVTVANIKEILYSKRAQIMRDLKNKGQRIAIFNDYGDGALIVAETYQVLLEFWDKFLPEIEKVSSEIFYRVGICRAENLIYKVAGVALEDHIQFVHGIAISQTSRYQDFVTKVGGNIVIDTNLLDGSEHGHGFHSRKLAPVTFQGFEDCRFEVAQLSLNEFGASSENYDGISTYLKESKTAEERLEILREASQVHPGDKTWDYLFESAKKYPEFLNGDKWKIYCPK